MGKTAVTGERGGGGGGVAPVAPDPRLPGAVDAHRVAPDLDEVHGPGPQAGQEAGGLVPHVLHHLGGRRSVRDTSRDTERHCTHEALHTRT